MKTNRCVLSAATLALALPGMLQGAAAPASGIERPAKNGNKPRNVIFILSDDHRFDFMGFMGTVPWLQTPAMDKMAREGAHIRNAFVTTSLSSPSRCSILTSLYTHEHTVVDNQASQPANLVFFPQYLQQAGYKTAFFGKWHMGTDDDMPRPGFDHWEGFRGQGTYYNVMININGKRTKFSPELFSSDIITDHTIDFIDANKKNPFFVYLSYKSVHSPFDASPSRKGMYQDKPIVYPPSFNVPHYGIPQLPSKDANGKPLEGRGWYGPDRMPDWVKNQRESWHGVDYQYHGAKPYETDLRNYCEAITSMDDDIGRLMEYLKKEGLDRSTLVIYMGDNGFTWGEHGLIDKRTFYESSVRVPMLAYCPELIKPGTVVDQMVQNVDIGPTVMDACGIGKASQMRGSSFLPLVGGQKVSGWRDRIFYEYYWEYDYPQTPTVIGVRTDRYKYIRYLGVWDTNEFYDLASDPHETMNLIDKPELQDTIKAMVGQMYDWLEGSGGMQIPLKRTIKYKEGDHRNKKVY
ncbi:acetylglucosamine-6-sulfatase [Bacteroidia bacterium]|nr:acetylglucosamine-6-sulfatase [Bacteroidia bacterium]